ncbi:hypothetical protein BKA93DRAFT_828890 [Sparassis latifolia]
MSSLDKQLLNLASTLTAKALFSSGTLAETDLLLDYAKGEISGKVDLLHATENELQRLSETCDAAPFGVGQENVHDESYRKAGKFDVPGFSVHFDASRPGLTDNAFANLFDQEETSAVRAELYKLNVHDSPRSQKMFGSLVVIFPTLRHGGQSWTFDSREARSCGRDYQLLQSYKELSLKVYPHVIYEDFGSDVEVHALCSYIVLFPDDAILWQPEELLWSYLRKNASGDDEDKDGRDIVMNWVTLPPQTERPQSTFVTYGNEAYLSFTYIQPCLIVDIGKVGNPEDGHGSEHWS